MRDVSPPPTSAAPHTHDAAAGAGVPGADDACPAAPSRGAAAVFTRYADALAAGAVECPLPGGGRTAARFEALSAVAREDLCAARLVEGGTKRCSISSAGCTAPRSAAAAPEWAWPSSSASSNAMAAGCG